MSLPERMLETFADSVTVQDRDYTIIYQNPSMQRVWGAHVGEKCYRFYEQRATVCEGCGLKTVLETGSPVTSLRTAVAADGTTAYWENVISPVLDEQGRIIGGSEVCRNVSDRVSLEDGVKTTNIRLGQRTAELEVRVADRTADLERARAFLGTILESLGDPLFVKDAQFRYVHANHAFCEFLHRSRAELIGKTDFELFPRSEAEVFRTFDEGVLQTREQSRQEEEVTTAEGITRNIIVTKTCFTDPRGEKFIVAIFRDITERRELEQQLRQVQKMESIGMLAGGIAHDFNNLLTPILGGADLLLLNAGDARDAALLRDVQNAAARLRDLTQRLLAFSRKQVLELRRTDLREVVRHFEPVLRRTLRENVRIVVDAAAELEDVLADAGQIEQVLLNLALNAQDAMPDGGTLSIAVSHTWLESEYMRQHPELRPGPYVQLTVTDTGCGMDAGTLARIFEPFFTTKEGSHGIGLGLSMVYGIVKQQGGGISVSSEPGRGTTFLIHLPQCPADAPRAPQSVIEAAGETAQAQETVLVVEDNEIVRHTACEMLRRLGYEVLSADGLEACMALVKEHEGPIHLLLADVVLPDSSGREIGERLQAEGRVQKVLYMSGYTSDVIVHHGVLDAGVQFIQKPLTFYGLARRVRQMLDSP